MKDDLFSDLLASAEEMVAMEQERSKQPDFGRTTIQTAMSSVMGKALQSMAVPESYLGTPNAEQTTADMVRLSMETVQGKSKRGAVSGVQFATIPAQESRFDVGDLAKFQLDITEEHLRSEAAGFLAWLFDCLKGLGFTSVDGARDKGYKFLMLDSLQAERGPWPRIDERMVVVLSPDGEKIAQRKISAAAITRLDAVFEESVSSLKK